MNQTDTMRIYRYNLTLRKEENPDSMCFLMGYSRKHRAFSTKDSCQKKHKTISIILVLQEILETGQYRGRFDVMGLRSRNATGCWQPLETRTEAWDRSSSTNFRGKMALPVL